MLKLSPQPIARGCYVASEIRYGTQGNLGGEVHPLPIRLAFGRVASSTVREYLLRTHPQYTFCASSTSTRQVLYRTTSQPSATQTTHE